jgi:hypothetical protein
MARLNTQLISRNRICTLYWVPERRQEEIRQFWRGQRNFTSWKVIPRVGILRGLYYPAT